MPLHLDREAAAPQQSAVRLSLRRSGEDVEHRGQSKRLGFSASHFCAKLLSDFRGVGAVSDDSWSNEHDELGANLALARRPESGADVWQLTENRHALPRFLLLVLDHTCEHYRLTRDNRDRTFHLALRNRGGKTSVVFRHGADQL